MVRQTLIKKAEELMAIINGFEKQVYYQITTFVPEGSENHFFVYPAVLQTLWNVDKILAWANLNSFLPIFTVNSDNQPCIKLLRSEFED